MRSEHKVRQSLFHMFIRKHSDDIANLEYTVDFTQSSIVDYAVRYLTEPTQDIQYPGKAYAVALLYAVWLETRFDCSFYKVLEDPGLLFNNDRFFEPYNEHTYRTYDEILERINIDWIDVSLPQISTTLEYFNEEFFLVDNPFFVNV